MLKGTKKQTEPESELRRTAQCLPEEPSVFPGLPARVFSQLARHVSDEACMVTRRRLDFGVKSGSAAVAFTMPRAHLIDGDPPKLVSAKIGSITRWLSVNEIRLIKSCENYTEVTLAQCPRLLVRRTMRQWIALLPATQFAPVYRSLLVNLAQIGRVERTTPHATTVHFIGDVLAPLEIKRRHWPALRVRLDAWRITSRVASPLAGSADGKSIAVLPFANLSRDPADEVSCDGVTEEILNVVARIPGLRVAARTSAFSFKGRKVAVSDIARQLGVSFVLQGSVRKAGRRVRISAQLINAVDGFQMWSDKFDRDEVDIFALQDDIAAQIAKMLQLKLADSRPTAAPLNPEAHSLALEGRHFWNLRTNDGFKRAEVAFTQALALAPDFARARSGLADVYNIRALYRLADGAIDVSDDLQRARDDAQRAIHLDGTLGEARATLAFVHFHEGRLDEAQRELQQAFISNPNYATAYQFYAWTLCAQGRLDRALDEFSKGIALDPLSFINMDRYAAMLALAGKFAEALAVNERAAALRPDVFVGNVSQRAPLLFALGRRDEAVAAARSVRDIARDVPFRRNSDSDAIHVLHQAGLTWEAADYAAEVLARLPVENHLRGFVLAAIGRYDDALKNLARAPTIMLPFLFWSQLWDPARNRPAFHQLIGRLGRTVEYRVARATLDQMLGKNDAHAVSI